LDFFQIEKKEPEPDTVIPPPTTSTPKISLEVKIEEETEIQHYCRDCDINWSTKRGK